MRQRRNLAELPLERHHPTVRWCSGSAASAWREDPPMVGEIDLQQRRTGSFMKPSTPVPRRHRRQQRRGGGGVEETPLAGLIRTFRRGNFGRRRLASARRPSTAAAMVGTGDIRTFSRQRDRAITPRRPGASARSAGGARFVADHLNHSAERCTAALRITGTAFSRSTEILGSTGLLTHSRVLINGARPGDRAGRVVDLIVNPPYLKSAFRHALAVGRRRPPIGPRACAIASNDSNCCAPPCEVTTDQPDPLRS